MSRDNPQLRVRISPELKEELEDKAAKAGRTLTAEIVHRLEESLFREQPPADLLPAEKARELSTQSRQSLPAEIFVRVIAGINRGIALGHNSAMVDLGEFELDAMDEDKSALIVEMLEQRLKAAGYQVEWDGLEHIMIDF